MFPPRKLSPAAHRGMCSWSSQAGIHPHPHLCREGRAWGPRGWGWGEPRPPSLQQQGGSEGWVEEGVLWI